MFSENDLEYEEIKGYANNIYEGIKKEEVNYEYEHIEEIACSKTKQIIDEDKKTEYCKKIEIIEDQDAEIIECRNQTRIKK